MTERGAKKVESLGERNLRYRAEHEAREMSRNLHGSDGLWELFLVEAYQRIIAQDKAP